MNKKVRVGIIGTGVGVRTYLPSFRSIPEASVVAISGSNPERGREVAQKYDIPIAYDTYEELCADTSLDLICVGSPNAFHFEHYQTAIKANKAVLLEKPAAIDSAGLQQLLSLPTGEDQIVLVGHQLRFNPYMIALREAIIEGRIGRPYYLRIHQQGTGAFSAATPYSWSFDAAQGGGVRLAMGSHLVDLAHYLLSDTQTNSVFANMDVVHPIRNDHQGLPQQVTASATFACLMRHAATSVALSASAAAASENLFDIDVLGTDGEAHFSLANKLFISGRHGRQVISEPDGVEPEEIANAKSIFRTSFTYLARALVNAIVEEGQASLAPGCLLADQIPTLQVLDAVLESAKSGNSVRLLAPNPATAAG